MSPTAAGMAATLHLLVAFALVWGTPLKNFEVPEHAIDVTMEEPPAPKTETPTPPPPAPPAAQAQPAPPPPAAQPQPTARLGAPPVQANPTPTEKPKPTEQTSVPLGVKPPSERSTEPPQQAAAQPPPPQKETPPTEPTPPPETKLPPVETPQAPLSMQDFVRASPPPPLQEIVRPQPRVQPAPPPATVQQAPPQQQFAPSPLGHPPSQQPRALSDSQASATLVNPADAAARSRAADEYVWAVIRKFSQYLPDLREKNEGGTVVVRAVIARDGRLLESSIARSSGVAALDKGMLEALRAAAPYPPLPAELPGDHIVFTQPITAKR